MAHWKFDETSGSVASDSAGANSVTLQNGATWSAGKIGSGALSLDGVNDRAVRNGASFGGAGDMTIAAWVKKTSDTNAAFILDMQAGNTHVAFQIEQRNGANKVCLGNWTNGILCTAPGSITPYLGQWVHLAVTRPKGGTGTRIYINGVEKVAGNVGADIGGSTLWGVGGAPDIATARPFKGQIDDLRVYSRLLTSTELQALVAGTTAPAPSDTTAPVLSSGSPSGVLPAGTTSATISLKTNETATCRYSTTAGVAYASMSGRFTTTGATTHSHAVSGCTNGGSYAYYVRCADQAGNSNISDYPIAFSIGATSTDTVAPSVAISAPTNGSSVSGTVTVAASATDNVGVTKVEFFVDGALKIADTTSPYSYVWDTKQVTVGAHSLTAKAYDAAGNSTVSTTVSVTVTSASQGSQYYVSTTGNDSNPGTLAQPWRSIMKAVATMNPGDTTFVRGGTYNKFVPIGFSAGTGYDGSVAKNGTATAPITLKAYPGEKVIWTNDLNFPVTHWTMGRMKFLDIRERSYWTIEGFTFDHTQTASTSIWWYYGMYVAGTSTKPAAGIVIRGNTFDGNEIERPGGTVIDLRYTDNAIVENNVFRMWSARTIDSSGVGGVVLETEWRYDAATAVPNRNTVIRNNTFEGIGGDGVQVGPWSGYNTLIENNLFNTRYNEFPWFTFENAVDIKKSWFTTVRSNTMWGYRKKTTKDPHGGAILVHLMAEDVVIDNNKIYDNNTGIVVSNGNPALALPTPAWYKGSLEVYRVTISRNIIYNSNKQNQAGGGAGPGIGVRGDGINGLVIYHNVIANSEDTGIRLANNKGLVINNNIIHRALVNDIFDESSGKTDLVQFKIGSNFFDSDKQRIMYRLSNGYLSAMSLSQFQAATGQAAGSKAGVPSFVNPTKDASADYCLKFGSPAIDAATRILGFNDTFSGAAPDMGAVEFK